MQGLSLQSPLLCCSLHLPKTKAISVWGKNGEQQLLHSSCYQGRLRAVGQSPHCFSLWNPPCVRSWQGASGGYPSHSLLVYGRGRSSCPLCLPRPGQPWCLLTRYRSLYSQPSSTWFQGDVIPWKVYKHSFSPGESIPGESST